MRADVMRMTATLHHRGPDDHGHWCDPGAGLALGFRRLAIVDLSPQGHQPMESEDGRFVLVFNGEIYNHREIRSALRRHGEVDFRGRSDTEVLIRAIARWGLREAIGRSVGMFALALWDRRERTLNLARDRIGEKPLHYGWSGGLFLFGSELKALLAHPRCRAEIDPMALDAYLRRGHVPAPGSIYKRIHKLTPGTILTLDAGDLARGQTPTPIPYWSAAEAVEMGASDRFGGTIGEAVDRLDGLMREAVAQQMVADVPVGAFLSGGIDSTAVVSLMQSMSPRPIRTFTIGFEAESHDEAGHARAIARHLGTEHEELYVTEREVRDVLPRLPSIFDEPFADASQIPTFLVARLARRAVTVCLTGDGGDELFAGYSWYTRSERVWGRLGRVPSPIRRGMASALTSLSPLNWDRFLDAARPLLPGPSGRQASGDRIHKFAAILRRMRDARSIHHALCSSGVEPSALMRQVGESGTRDDDRPMPRCELIEQLMFLDLTGFLPDDILTKVDRSTMAVGLESRAPLLDHRIVEFAWRVPLAWKVRDGRQKWLLRQVLAKYVPDALVDRPKSGFCPPLGSWLEGPLRDWAESLLDERVLRDDGFLHAGPVRRIWDEHVHGHRNWQQALWCVLMFQAWLHTPRPQFAPPSPAAIEAATSSCGAPNEGG